MQDDDLLRVAFTIGQARCHFSAPPIVRSTTSPTVVPDTQREVTDGEQVTWTCVQAYAGLGESAAAAALEERRAAEGRGVPVVCTPTGGAQSVRLELAGDWLESMSDESLLAEIEAKRVESGE